MDEFTSAEQALAVVHEVVQPISTDDLHRPTPCRDWDVETLAQHLVDTISRLGPPRTSNPQSPPVTPSANAYSKLRNRSWQDGAAAD